MRFLNLALSFIAVSYGQDDTCSLECYHNAPCTKGSADFSSHPTYPDGQALEFHQTLHHNGMHCNCPHGWTGITCDRIYVSCDGSHACYNGGNCIPGIKDLYDNEQLFCDCSNTFDENGNPYVGKFCEHLSKEDCGTDDRFCVNDGECNGSSEGSPCDCPDDFEGPHCEFKKGSVAPCTLDCKNGGQCQFGIPPEASKYHDLDHMFVTNNTRPDDLMYCICPEDFSGKFCEIEIEKCGPFMCYNGGSCIEEEYEVGSLIYRCDCSTVNNSQIFSGRFCQFEATSTCDEDDTSDSDPLFCVNDGTCPNDGSKRCNCDDSFSGIHCEYLDIPEEWTPTPSSTEVDPSAPSVTFYEGTFPPSTVTSYAPEAPVDNPTEGILPTDTEAPVIEITDVPSISPAVDPQPTPTVEPPVTDDPQPTPTELLFDPPVPNDPTPTPTELTFEPSVTNDQQPTPTEVIFEPPVTSPVTSIATMTPNLNVCKLSCMNNGQCKKGVKSLGIIESIAHHIAELNKTSNADSEYCECPLGFVGLQCEHVMQICPGEEHVCLHGSKCVKSGDEQICDCRAATDYQLAGPSCQHKSYISCNKDEIEFTQPRSFCVNGGICLKLVSGDQDHPGCECLNKKWTGPHCELHNSIDDRSTASKVNVQEQSNSSQSAMLALGILSLILAIVVSVYTYHRDKRNRQGWKRELSPNTAPQVHIGPPRDEDGNELHHINIL